MNDGTTLTVYLDDGEHAPEPIGFAHNACRDDIPTDLDSYEVVTDSTTTEVPDHAFCIVCDEPIREVHRVWTADGSGSRGGKNLFGKTHHLVDGRMTACGINTTSRSARKGHTRISRDLDLDVTCHRCHVAIRRSLELSSR